MGYHSLYPAVRCHNPNFTFVKLLSGFPSFQINKSLLQFPTDYFIHTFILILFFHSLIHICYYFLQKLLIQYTTSTQQQAQNKVRYFNPVLNYSALPLNYSTPNTND